MFVQQYLNEKVMWQVPLSRANKHIRGAYSAATSMQWTVSSGENPRSQMNTSTNQVNPVSLTNWMVNCSRAQVSRIGGSHRGRQFRAPRAVLYQLLQHHSFLCCHTLPQTISAQLLCSPLVKCSTWKRPAFIVTSLYQHYRSCLSPWAIQPIPHWRQYIFVCTCVCTVYYSFNKKKEKKRKTTTTKNS